MDYKKTILYNQGKKIKALGECLMNPESTIDDLAKCSYDCELSLRFTSIPIIKKDSVAKKKV